jgi:hypothetical protein
MRLLSYQLPIHLLKIQQTLAESSLGSSQLSVQVPIAPFIRVTNSKWKLSEAKQAASQCGDCSLEDHGFRAKHSLLLLAVIISVPYQEENGATCAKRHACWKFGVNFTISSLLM